MEGLATRGQELAPNDPSFLDTRNAMIQADVVNNGGANVDALWAVFAQRGMGFFASSPDGSDTSPIEDFSCRPTARWTRAGRSRARSRTRARAPRSPARVFIAGHSSGFATILADTTDGGGTFDRRRAVPLSIPSSSSTASVRAADPQRGRRRGRERGRQAGSRLGGPGGRRGPRVVHAPNYAPFCGVNADGAFDLSLSSGWPSDADSTAGSNKAGPRRPSSSCRSGSTSRASASRPEDLRRRAGRGGRSSRSRRRTPTPTGSRRSRARCPPTASSGPSRPRPGSGRPVRPVHHEDEPRERAVHGRAGGRRQGR